MSFRTTPAPDIQNFNNNPVLWAAAVTAYLGNQGRDLETESLARERATKERFTVTGLGTSGTMTLNVSTATLAELRVFVAELIKALQQRRIIRASVS